MAMFVKIIATFSRTFRVKEAVKRANQVEDTSIIYDACGDKGGVYGGN